MSYSNFNFSGSSQASHSPSISLPYIWDNALNGGDGAWRPTKTGDFGEVTIENASIAVDLDYTEDSVNVWTSNAQTLSATGNLQVGDSAVSDSNRVPANATLQVSDTDASKTNPVPTVGVLVGDSYISNNTTAANASAGATGTAQTMFDGSYQLSSHGYLVEITPQSDEYRGVFEVEASSDGGSTWVLLEQQVLSGSSAAASGVAYFDNWNFPKSRVSISTINSRVAGANCPNLTGGFVIRETHTP